MKNLFRITSAGAIALGMLAGGMLLNTQQGRADSDLSFTMNGAGTALGGSDVNIDTYFHGIGVQFIETPEPASWLLLSAGLGLLAFRRRSRV